MRTRLTLALILTTALVGCGEFPQLDEAVDSDARDAKYPNLVPVESLYAQIPDPLIDNDTAPDLETRVARLRARAARLKRTVIDRRTRARFKAGVT